MEPEYHMPLSASKQIYNQNSFWQLSWALYMALVYNMQLYMFTLYLNIFTFYM